MENSKKVTSEEKLIALLNKKEHRSDKEVSVNC